MQDFEGDYAVLIRVTSTVDRCLPSSGNLAKDFVATYALLHHSNTISQIRRLRMASVATTASLWACEDRLPLTESIAYVFARLGAR